MDSLIKDYILFDSDAEPWLVEWGLKGRSNWFDPFWSNLHPKDQKKTTPRDYARFVLKSARQKASDAWATVVLLMRTLGYAGKLDGPSQQRRGFNSNVGTRFVARAFALYLNGRFEAWMKFHLAAFFSRATFNEDPACPAEARTDRAGIFIGGGASLFLKGLINRCRDRPEKFLHFAQQVLMAKKGFPPMWEWQAKNALIDHEQLLTTDKGFLSPRTERETRICQSISKTVKELFSRYSHQLDPEQWALTQSFHCPSSSAHFHTTRGVGGAAATLSFENTLPNIKGLFLSHEQSISTKYSSRHPWCDQGRMRTAGIPMDGFDFEPEIELQQLGLSQSELDSIEDSLIKKVNDRLDDRLYCEPVPLVEPFKVRVITKELEEEAYVASYFQRILWRELANHPVFELVGKPVTAEVLEPLLNAFRATFDNEETELWSVDYKSATDNLRKWAIHCTVEELTPHFKWTRAQVRFIEKNLSDHVIKYGERMVNQENGQLMGNPISFPILCIINAAVARLNLDETLRVPLRKLPIRINGDDGLIVSSRLLYDRWKQDVTSVGLELSVGKNYRSRNFAIINSTLFIIKTTVDFFGQIIPHFVEKPYLSLGLLKCINVKRNEAEDERSRLLDVQPVWTKLLEACKVSGFDRILAENVFLRHWKRVLMTAPPGMSWYLPVRLGGVGFSSTRAKYSKQQLRVAAWLASPRSLESELEVRSLLSCQKAGEASYYSEVLKILRLREHLFTVSETEPDQESYDAFTSWMPVLGPRVWAGGADLRTSVGTQFHRWFKKLWKAGTNHGMDPYDPCNEPPCWRRISRIGPEPNFRPTSQLMHKIAYSQHPGGELNPPQDHE